MLNKTKSRLPLIVALVLYGTLQAQICKTSIIETSPTSRFVTNGDGTVIDNTTDLIWMRCSLGYMWDGSTCTGTASRYNWQEALQLAENTSFSGVSDWRLPSIKELTSIVEDACHDPAINLAVFPGVLYPFSQWWSSSPSTQISYHAWSVSFSHGTVNSVIKNNEFHLRLVRGGL